MLRTLVSTAAVSFGLLAHVKSGAQAQDTQDTSDFVDISGKDKWWEVSSKDNAESL